MCIQSFLAGKQGNIGRRFLYSVLVVIGIGDLLDKIVYRQGAGEFCRAAGGQRVIGARIIVTECLGAVSAKEYRACIFDLIKIIKGIVYTDLQMLGGNAIGDLNCLPQIGANNDLAKVIDRGACDLLAGQ